MSWTKKKTYKPKKFRPRQRTKDDVEYQRQIERARDEAKQHAIKLESERKAKQLQLEKEAQLRRELALIQRKQALIKQHQDDARKYFQQKRNLWQHRLKLRPLNLEKNKTKPNTKNLETKIKKIQGFLKKTKQFEKHSKNIQSLIREMEKLKLGPYIDEVIKDLTTTNIADKAEIDKLLHLVSAIHYRFDINNNRMFLKPFRDAILDCFRPVSKEKLNKKKQLLNLSILIEMQYLGLIKTNSNTICELLRHIIKTQQKHKEKLTENIRNAQAVEVKRESVDDNNYKFEDNKNKKEIMDMIFEYDEIMIHTLDLIIRFLKYTNEECLGEVCVLDEKYYRALDKEVAVEPHEIFSSKQKKQICDLVMAYYLKISGKYLQLDLKLRKQRRMNNIILIERGCITDNRQDITDELEEVVGKMKVNLQFFVDYLPNTLQFPEELAMNEDKITLNIDGQLTSLSDAQNASFFDDAVSRSFYENIPELKDNIPGSLLQGDNIKPVVVEKADIDADNADIDGVNITDMPAYLVDVVEDDYEEEEEDKKQYTMKDLLAALQCMGSRKETEFLAEKFCYLNSRNNRKYLASVLSSCGSMENTRLPFYCRFIAILNLSQINIGDRVCLSIEKEFYRLFLSKKSYLMDAKMANLSYIAELAKFSIFPFRSVFNILEKLSKKFNNECIELLSFFMFQCGRFLYKNPLTHIRLNKILKYLKQRQARTNLDKFLNQHINNAIFACKPPEKSACLQFENLNDLQKYMEHLLYFKLNHHNKQKILKKLRKLPWKEYAEFIVSKLFNISIVNFDKIDCIAAIIAGLNCYHSISTSIVDNVCEEIRIGLEEEDFTQEQRRLSYVKFLGELYTYKAVNSQVIFDTLYLFITYECNMNEAGNDDGVCNFRISLSCMLLEVCGKYLRKGKLKARCDRFLLYFQRFILNREGVIPFDIEWWVNDVFTFIAPNMERYFSLEKILEKIKKLETNAVTMKHKDALLVLDEDEDEYEEEYEEEAELEEEEEFVSSSEDDTADVNSYHRKKKITKHDKLFIDEYDAMMEQYRSGNAKKSNISNLKHASVLVGDLDLNKSGKGSKLSDSTGSEEDEYGDVSYTLLSKKGATSSKLKIGVIKIPKQIIATMKLNQKKDVEAADKIKAVTLQHLQSYENEDEDEEEYADYTANYGMIDEENNVNVVSTKSKFKQHSISAKRKYNQNIKQMQHQKIEDEREKQKNQRDEKRKKQAKFAAVTQDFE